MPENQDDHRETRELPTPDQPLNADRRPRLVPVLGVVALIVVIAVIFAVITYVQQHT